MSAWLSFAALVFIGAVHSGLGEALLLRPLFEDPTWRVRISRSKAQLVLRFAWHLTSVAWLGLAATLVGVPVGLAVGATCLVSGLVVLLTMRSHLAWPVFMFAGLTALDVGGHLPAALRIGVITAAVVVAALVGGLHVYWAMGGRRGLATAIPSRPDGRPMFAPGPVSCLAVAGAVTAFAALLVAMARGGAPAWVRLATGAALLLLVVRAVGDGRQVGFSKRDRSTAFARADDALYTPLVVVLLLGASLALLPG